MKPFLVWWAKYSLIAIIFTSFLYTFGHDTGLEPLFGTWTRTFLIMLTPVGAFAGQIIGWAIKLVWYTTFGRRK